MPARKKMTPVEAIVMLAMLGILASIALPAMTQAQRRTLRQQRAARVYRPPLGTAASDGQLNTIEVSPLSQSAERGNPSRAVGALLRFVPLLLGLSAIYVFANWVRREQVRRRAR